MFSNYSSAATFDELIDAARQPRIDVRRASELLARLGLDELRSRQRAAEATIRAVGITFTIHAQNNNIDRDWPFDIIPRVIAQREWDRIARGLRQRLQVLNLFIDDVYNEQRAVRAGIFPGELLASSKNYLAFCHGMRPRFGAWAHICGTDLVRDRDGTMYVLEDNLRVPSVVSYLLENRAVAKRVFPELFDEQRILPIDGYPGRVYELLPARVVRNRPEPSRTDDRA